MPGLLLCFVLRYDAYKKAQHAKMAEAGIPLPSNWARISYFHCSLFGYFLGLLTATISSEVRVVPLEYFHVSISISSSDWILTTSDVFQVFKAAQPALLYLVPFTLLPLFAMAYLKVNFFNSIQSTLVTWYVTLQFSLTQGELRSMWSEPFTAKEVAKYQSI